MIKIPSIIPSGTTGEVSPLLEGRVDLSKFYSSFRFLENWTLYPHGPYTRRDGTYFVAEAKHRDKTFRLIPFIFSVEQAYQLEFGEEYMRVFMDGGAVAETAKNITGATKADPVVITSAAHGYSNGKEVYIADIAGMTEINGKRFIVAGKTDDAFNLTDKEGANIDGTGYTTYVSGGKAYKIYEISTPYAEADLIELQYTQSADVMYITHPDYPTRKLARTGHTSWTLTEVNFIDGPYLPSQDGGLTPSAVTGSITITSDDALFVAGDVNRLIRLLCTGAVHRWVKITAYTNSTHVTATVKGNNLPNTNKVTSFRLGYWSNGNGFPYTCSFHEQRLKLGGCPEYPNTAWGSKAGSDSFEIFTPGTDDADPITYTIATDQVNAIRWLSSGLFLAIGAGDGEFSLRSTSLNEPLTPSNVKANREDTAGCAYIMPIRIGRSVIFAQRARRKILELASRFTEEGDSFFATDLTLLAEHITKSGVVQMAYQKEPGSILWCILDNGTPVAMTFQKQHDVVGWHRHNVGGAVETISVIPNTSHDEVWFGVKRTVNEIVRRYIEYLKPTDYVADIKDAFYVDSGLTYDGEPATSLSGFDHLEGETMKVLADGMVQSDKVVSGGVIPLDRSASVVQAGKGFTSTAKYQRPEPNIQSGTVQGKEKRVSNLMLRVLNTLGLKAGADENSLKTIIFPKGNMGEASPLVSGDMFLYAPTDFSKDGDLMVVQDEPLPATVIMTVPTYVIGEE